MTRDGDQPIDQPITTAVYLLGLGRIPVPTHQFAGVMMNQVDLDQRLEEIELALAGIVESPKAPSISSYDEGERLFLQLSWVVDSHADTTLDKRCAITVAMTRAQFERYASLDTPQRKNWQARLAEWVNQRFGERPNPQALEGDCAVELQLPNEFL
jgi:hypothetical protein